MGSLKMLAKAGPHLWKSASMAVARSLTAGQFSAGGPLFCGRLGLGSHLPAVTSLSITGQPLRCYSTSKDTDDKVKNVKTGRPDIMPAPDTLAHFKDARAASDGSSPPPVGTYVLPHPIWSEKELEQVAITHKEPKGKVEKLAFRSVKLMRGTFDLVTGFKTGKHTEKKWLARIIFLETVAGVPGMVAAMLRHLRSLRKLRRDFGWIHTLLEEAENERMHLMVALEIRKPSVLFNTAIVGAQGVFVSVFSVAYMFSPRFCHSFVGYLEEEAVKTYTRCIEDIDSGCLSSWQTRRPPDLAIRYWKLGEDATLRGMILAIRADEAHHRKVNHTLASMTETQFNPYKPGH